MTHRPLDAEGSRSVGDVAGFGALRRRLREGATVFGYIVSIPSTRVVRRLASAGCDFVIIETEHSYMNPESVHDLIMATSGTPCGPLVRVAAPNEESFAPALDAGAVGMWVPHVEDADDAREAVRLARYSEQGERGAGAAFALDRWQLSRGAYRSIANEAVVIGAMLESKQAVAQLPSILEVEGIDVIAIGRSDLAESLGHGGDLTHPELLQQVAEIERLVLGAGRVLGDVARSPADARRLVGRGYRWVCLGNDATLIGAGASAAIEDAAALVARRPVAVD